MKKYIVIAEEGERDLIRQAGERLGIVDELAACEVLVTGVGAVNILRALRDIPRDAALLNIGYAGSANFSIGTLVEVTEAALHHPNVSYPEPALPLSAGTPCEGILCAKCYTNTDFVLQSPYRDCVFDMELAFIAAMGFTRLRALKYVSDNLSLHAYHDLTRGVENNL